MGSTAVVDRPADEATAAAGGLVARLRAATAEAHQTLEAKLDLLRAPVSPQRIVGAVEGFFGFHAVWEPAMQAQEVLAPVWAGRSRLVAIRADLKAFGLDPAAIEALPRCAAAAGLAATPWRALGSLYVLEGSTLGGQVIGRALAGQPWLPPGGLRTFDPYGAETGARWRAFAPGPRRWRRRRRTMRWSTAPWRASPCWVTGWRGGVRHEPDGRHVRAGRRAGSGWLRG